MTGCIFKRKLPSGKTSWGYSIDIGKDANGKCNSCSRAASL